VRFLPHGLFENYCQIVLMLMLFKSRSMMHCWHGFSIDRDSPFTFELGASEVIKGFEQGLVDMCVGEKRKLTIPSHLAYGDEGAGESLLLKPSLCMISQSNKNSNMLDQC